MVNDYHSKDADKNEENNKLGMSDVLSDLYAEKEQLLKKIEIAKFINRHIELTEGYITTVLKHMKKDEVLDVLKVVVQPDIAKTVKEYTPFTKALKNAMKYHEINTLRIEFFECFGLYDFSSGETIDSNKPVVFDLSLLPPLNMNIVGQEFEKLG